MRALVRLAAIALAGAAHPGDGLQGVMTPISDPMLPRGAGLVFLGTNGGRPLLPSSAYLTLEGLCALTCLAIAWRRLFSYFFLIPVFAAVAVARMPLGALTPERARAAGALTLFALPARRVRLVAGRGRAA